MIPDSFIQDLLARVDIVDLVDGFVPLKKAGANYAACCPFHNEKSPSFTVSPTKQFYHCFGCGAHGTAISFVMEYQGLGFIDAVKELAQRAGMQVPESEGRGARDEKPGQTRMLIEIMARAGKISSDAHARAMRMAKPGMFEYQVEAEILHEFLRNGARQPAYGSIVATGGNACVLHYRENSAQIKKGDLMLIHFRKNFEELAAAQMAMREHLSEVLDVLEPLSRRHADLFEPDGH